MRIKERKQVCRALGKTEFFTPSVIERFVNESQYKQRRSWVLAINDAKMVAVYLETKADEICRQRRHAFHELCLMELQECMNIPEVKADERVSRYMRMIEGLYDGSALPERYKLQCMTDKLELNILHSISKENKVLLRAFLKVACLYSYKMLDYHTAEKERLTELCKAL